ncbi:MAG: NADPH-dependent FMN reductase, partial [bacterium]
MKNILFIIGSMRKESFNRQLAQEVEQMLASDFKVTYLDYRDVPLINQDEEFPTPEAVEKVRQSIREADGLWIFTPEYNDSYPGLLKNLIDWMSRPYRPQAYADGTAIMGKKVAI